MNRDSIKKDLIGCEEILSISENILRSDFKNNSISTELSLLLNELKGDLQDQLIKFKKDTYEIAVVGREKSGKSSLLNAFISFDLLPAQRKRCTYTTTELRSCQSINEQKYLIEYFSKEEFHTKIQVTVNSLDSFKGKVNRDRDLVQQEIEEIEQLKDEIERYLGRPNSEKQFQSFNDVRGELNSAISEPGQARAIKKVCIWTPVLNSSDKIVLYDVPGYDSPITLHKEQTRAKIASVDSILYAKQFASPDLVDSEIEILKISDSSNPYIKAKDKIIVSLTCCDVVNSSREYNDLTLQHQNAWKGFGVIPSRIVPVCSIAELNPGSTESETVKMRLEQLNSGKTGFKELKAAVKSCVEDSRNKIIKDRCDELKNKLKEFTDRLFQLIKTDYNIDLKTEVQETLGDFEMNKIYVEWWAMQWKHIHEDFQTFFQTVIRPKSDADAPAYLSTDAVNFKKSYEDIIDRTFKHIPATRGDRQKAIYVSCMGNDGLVSPFTGNKKIRDELSRDAINSIDRVTLELTIYLWKSIGKIIAWISNRLFNMPEIRREMIGSDDKEEALMRKAFDSLIQRVARPATDIFLSYPRSKLIRSKVLREYQMELMILDNFIENGKMKSRGIIPFIANGKLGKFQFDLTYEERLVVNKHKKDERQTNTDQTKKNATNDKDHNKIETRRKIATDRELILKKNKVEEKKIETVPIQEKESKINRFKGMFYKNKPESPEKQCPACTVLFEKRLNYCPTCGTKYEENTEDERNLVNSEEEISIKSSDIVLEEDFERVDFEIPVDKSKEMDGFDILEFSLDARNLDEIHVEIESDINEFISCMKNSVFYGSGIQRFYNQELDKYRRKFIELEEDKHRWLFLIQKYIKLDDAKIKIPAPSMADELKIRSQMTIGCQRINEITKDF